MSLALIPQGTTAAGATGMGSPVLRATWYFVTTQTLTPIPAVVEVVVAGAKEVIEEVVEGSKMVARCIAIGAVTIAVVQFGFWFLCSIGSLLRRHRPGASAAPSERYGGRLLGGASKEKGQAAMQRLTAAEALQAQLQRTVPKKAKRDARRELDVSRIKKGDRLLFAYLRGKRWAKCSAFGIDHTPTGPQLIARTAAGLT